jgi:carboxylesterase
MYSKEDLVKPLCLQGSNIGILLIHGFTACPIDLKPLGEILNSFGYTVYAPLLAGHGGHRKNCGGHPGRIWLASAEDGVNFLRESCRRVVAVGHSMGGLLVTKPWQPGGNWTE